MIVKILNCFSFSFSLVITVKKEKKKSKLLNLQQNYCITINNIEIYNKLIFLIVTFLIIQYFTTKYNILQQNSSLTFMLVVFYNILQYLV